MRHELHAIGMCNFQEHCYAKVDADIVDDLGL